MKKFSVRSFFLGLLSAMLILGVAAAAFGDVTLSGQAATIYPGVKIYVDDQLIEPKDGEGNAIEAFIYNGTAYLPMRAVATALGLPVTWEGATKSSYIGKHQSSTPAVMLADMDYFAGSSFIDTVGSDQDNMGGSHFNCIISGRWSRKYALNGQYTRMAGSVYQRYVDRSHYIGRKTSFEIYGDGKLLYACSFAEDTEGFRPTQFDVDLTGVLELEVICDRNGYGIAIGDCGLYT